MNTKNAQEIRHNDIKVGEKIIEVKYAPKGLRSIERGLIVYSDQSDQLFRSNPTVYRSEATMV